MVAISPPVELDGRDGVVDVADVAQAFVDGDRAGGEDARAPPRSEEPAHGVDVVDAHVEQDAAGGPGIADEESAGVILVGGLRARAKRAADRAGPDLVVGVAIAGVEPAHVADHRLLPRMLRRDRLHAQAIGEVERERLFREHVLAGLERRDDLVGVQRGRRREEHGVEPRMGEHCGVIARSRRPRPACRAPMRARPRRDCTRRRAARLARDARDWSRGGGPCGPRRRCRCAGGETVIVLSLPTNWTALATAPSGLQVGGDATRPQRLREGVPRAQSRIVDDAADRSGDHHHDAGERQDQDEAGDSRDGAAEEDQQHRRQAGACAGCGRPSTA